MRNPKFTNLNLSSNLKKRLSKYNFVFLFFVGIISTICSFGQMKVVVMGSSTAYGVGASVYDSSWVGRLEDHLNKNASDGLDTLVYNIAYPAYDTYQEMPTGFIPPTGRPLPDEFYNVTKALSFDPDVVIINLPSNDLNYGYAKSETMSNFRIMFSTITSNATRCYITTPQPRNDFDQSLRDSLFSMVDSVTNTFGAYAINFWDSLVTNDGQKMLRDELRAAGSPLHLNNRGHDILFEIIRNSYIFNLSPVALMTTNFGAELKNKSVTIKWHTEFQAANTNFEIQRSIDGNTFETVANQFISESRQSADYMETDINPLSGKSFYRLKITQPGKLYYTNIATILNEESLFEITKLYTDLSSNLLAELNIPNSQIVSFTIISSSGGVLLQYKQYLQRPAARVSLPLTKLAHGQYYLRIKTADGSTLVKGFIK